MCQVLLFVFIEKARTLTQLKKIQRLKSENRRDDALDIVKFFKENEQANPYEIESLEMDLEYSTAEKIKSLARDGLFKGQVYDTYSGLSPTLTGSYNAFTL